MTEKKVDEPSAAVDGAPVAVDGGEGPPAAVDGREGPPAAADGREGPPAAIDGRDGVSPAAVDGEQWRRRKDAGRPWPCKQKISTKSISKDFNNSMIFHIPDLLKIAVRWPKAVRGVSQAR